MGISKREAQRRADEKRAASRTRNWACLIYPDSWPENWREIIEELHVPCAVSPLHEFDLNEDQTPKKPHRHVVMAFDGVKTMAQVKELVAPLHGTTVIKLNSLVGYLRYLVHMDNPEKYQYDINEVETFSGMHYKEIIETASDKVAALSEITKYIDDNRISKYSELVRYCRDNRQDWFYIIANGYTMFLSQYLNGIWQEEEAARRNR